MAYRTAVLGASGYTGAELLRLLAGHPEMEVGHVTADSNAGASVAALYPSLAAEYPMLEYASYDPAAVDGVDVAFLALPHGESQRVVPELIDRVGHIVDLGADFRMPVKQYEQWYGEDHGAPELIERFAYGLPELFRRDVTESAHIAAPGCYPTATALALAPLLADRLIEPGIIVDAVSGVSGRGRGLSAPSLFSEANENVTPYGLLTHRHTGEMEVALGRVAGGQPVTVLFTPHLVPMTRGALATCHARAVAGELGTERLLETYRSFYAGEPFVAVLDDAPNTKATLASNAAHITVRFDARTESVLAICALDNLVKGAAGQMVQCANLVLGLPETTGLTAVGVTP